MPDTSDRLSAAEEYNKRMLVMSEQYHLTFSSPSGRIVLENMKQRAFLDRTSFGDNAPQHIRDAREGMRMFMFETIGFMIAFETGKYRQPMQEAAESATAEEPV